MSKIVTSKNKRIGQSNIGSFKPIIMLDALALIFAINTLLSWVECTYSNPTHQNYLQYYVIANQFKPRYLLIVMVLVTIIAILIHLKTTWSGKAYLSYFALFFDIITGTFLISGHYTGTNKLALFNFILAIGMYGLALAFYYTQHATPTSKWIGIVWGITAVINIVIGYILKVGIVGIVLNIVAIGIINVVVYLASVSLQSYIAKIMQSSSMLTANLDAIFHLPWALFD